LHRLRIRAGACCTSASPARPPPRPPRPAAPEQQQRRGDAAREAEQHGAAREEGAAIDTGELADEAVAGRGRPRQHVGYDHLPEGRGRGRRRWARHRRGLGGALRWAADSARHLASARGGSSMGPTHPRRGPFPFPWILNPKFDEQASKHTAGPSLDPPGTRRRSQSRRAAPPPAPAPPRAAHTPRARRRRN
jgi:hypothetical protein